MFKNVSGNPVDTQTSLETPESHFPSSMWSKPHLSPHGVWDVLGLQDLRFLLNGDEMAT